MILIVSHRRGFEADLVIDRLNERHVPVFRLNLDFVGQSDMITATLGEEPKVALSADGRCHLLSEVRAAWFHQPIPDARFDSSSTFEDHLRQMSFATLCDWIWSWPGITWLNHPRNAHWAANKLVQLQTARENGMHIPATVVTNDPHEAQEFCRMHEFNCVVKNISTPWLVGDGSTYAAQTRAVSADMFWRSEAISFAPLIYQERLRRVRDIRTVVVGDDFFSVSLFHEDPEAAPVDVRSIPISAARYEEFMLPESSREKILTLLRTLRVQYASIDLVEDIAGEIYFLDLNVTGAFWWVEEMGGHPISDAIATFLLGQQS